MVNLQNILLLELSSLEHLKAIRFEHKENDMSPTEFYTLITNGGEVAPFNDSQMQRLAHLFSGHDGTVIINNILIHRQHILRKIEGYD